MYKFEYELNDNDYIAFNHYQIHNSPAYKKRLFFTRFIYPFLFIAFSFLLANKFAYPILMHSICGTMFVVWIVFFNRYYNHLIKKQIAKLKKTGKLPYGKNVLLHFEEETIVLHSERGESKTYYTMLEKIALDKNSLYLYIGAVQAYIIPLRVFANDEERQALLTFINEKMPNAQ